ncbi:MAG TPA: hypothetical protein VHO84_10885 [Syntrophorhabdaceae bacterium]|nr:hypothetical protein [Syntrophorhabdaceae bacterium]
MKKIIIFILAAMFVSSCSYLPFTKKKDDQAKTAAKQSAPKKVDIEEAREPQPGDIKVIDGIEYIYGRNIKYGWSQTEPEYMWVRKDQYSPGLIQSLIGSALGTSQKERTALEDRIAKLEAELKKKNLAPQMGYPVQTTMLPMTLGSIPITFEYPSPKMKRRVLVLPTEDRTNYKNEHLGELATQRLISRLENTGVIICVDPQTLDVKTPLTDAETVKKLNETYGIQAIVKSTISEVFTSTAKIEGKDLNEQSFAMSRMSIDVVNTETGRVLKQLSGRNPISLTREKGELSPEKAKIKAIDLAIEMIAEDTLRAVLSLDWYARIASIDAEKNIYKCGQALRIGKRQNTGSLYCGATRRGCKNQIAARYHKRYA